MSDNPTQIGPTQIGPTQIGPVPQAALASAGEHRDSLDSRAMRLNSDDPLS